MKIILSLLPLLLMAATASAADSKPPNIVLIISDDQGYTDYGFMGHPSIETPHLDKLATESVLFRRGYVPTALCRPVTDDAGHRSVFASEQDDRKRPGEHARQQGPRRESGQRHQGTSHLPHRPDRRSSRVAGREGLRQPPKRQVVGRFLSTGRIHRGNDQGISKPGRTAWR